MSESNKRLLSSSPTPSSSSSARTTPSISSPSPPVCSKPSAQQIISTVPTKTINFPSLDEKIVQGSGDNHKGCSQIPSLDELVNDCFLKSINALVCDEEKHCLVDRFIDNLKKQHCEENLYFLIDIFKYEYNYNMKFYNHYNNDKSSRLNNTPSPDLINLKKSTSTLSFDSYTRSNKKRNSVMSDDLDPQNAFIQTIDDLDCEQEQSMINNINEQMWDNLRTKQIDQENDSDDDFYYDDDLTSEDCNFLNTNWNFIMNNYIKHDSPSQINISQKLFREIVEESSLNKIHNPICLLKAKNEVMRILKENGYFQFINQIKKEMGMKSPMMRSSHQRTPNMSSTSSTPGNNVSASSSAPISPIMSPISSNYPMKDHHEGFLNKLSSLPKRGKINNHNHQYNQQQQIHNDSSASSSISSISNILGHLKLGGGVSGSSTPINHSSHREIDTTEVSLKNISAISISEERDKESKDNMSSSFKFWRKRG